MPSYLFALILFGIPDLVVTPPEESRAFVLGGVMFTTFLVPGLGTYYMKRVGIIESLHLDDRSQRRLPLLFTTFCYGFITYVFRNESLFGELFFYVMLLITLTVFITYAVSNFWKISAHSVGMGGALGLLILLNSLLPESPLLYFIIGFVLLTGAVMSARLALNAHTPAQVYVGLLTGLVVSCSLLLFV